MALGTILQGIGAVAGLFGKKPKDNTLNSTIAGIVGQARGVDQASRESGINRLTLLGASSPVPSMTAGGPPPLASVALLGDVINQDKERKEDEAFNKLQTELLSLQVDRARSLAKVAPVSAVAGMGGTPALTGNLATRVSASPVRGTFGAPNILDARREKTTTPITNSAGVMEIDNFLTMGPIVVPGDSEPWGFDELATAVVVGIPQVALNGGFAFGEWLKSKGVDPFKKRRQTSDYLKKYPYGRDVYGRALPKPDRNDK